MDAAAVAELLCTLPVEGEDTLDDAAAHLSRPFLEAHDEQFHDRAAVRAIADAIEEQFVAEVCA